MLVLSRKPSETVHIGQDITITFLEVRGRVTKIGVDAPLSVCVLRGELCGGDGSPEPVDNRARDAMIPPAADC